MNSRSPALDDSDYEYALSPLGPDLDLPASFAHAGRWLAATLAFVAALGAAVMSIEARPPAAGLERAEALETPRTPS